MITTVNAEHKASEPKDVERRPIELANVVVGVVEHERADDKRPLYLLSSAARDHNSARLEALIGHEARVVERNGLEVASFVGLARPNHLVVGRDRKVHVVELNRARQRH